jgi:hypothetical protein
MEIIRTLEHEKSANPCHSDIVKENEKMGDNFANNNKQLILHSANNGKYLC